ncbi:hypothetical protein CPC08DRAFT_161717 [Agrocybe pediades]|nr:hypothetical protein CPC08DRAFT_161717 [Agrocybe pediades]
MSDEGTWIELDEPGTWSSLAGRLEALEISPDSFPPCRTSIASTLDLRGTSLHWRTRKCKELSKLAYPLRSKAVVSLFFGRSPGNSNQFSLDAMYPKFQASSSGLVESQEFVAWRCQESGVFGSVRAPSMILMNRTSPVSSIISANPMSFSFNPCFKVGNNKIPHPETSNSLPFPHAHTLRAASIHY